MKSKIIKEIVQSTWKKITNNDKCIRTIHSFDEKLFFVYTIKRQIASCLFEDHKTND